VTTLNKGLRNGGGIGDVLRQPSSQEPLYFFRVIYDMMFFFIVVNNTEEVEWLLR
ncbi:unnamed protein product, partial [Adineta steineri]